MTAADRVGADMIAMATHRDRLVERGILGSVTDTVLRTATLPVLAVNPDGDHLSSPAPGAPSTVIVPLDGSSLAEESVPAALDIAAACGAGVIFIWAVHLPTYAVSGPGAEFYGIDYGVSGEREHARKYLAKFVEQAESRGIPARAHAALGNAAGRILEETRNVPDAFIVISSHGRGGFRRMVLGSVADKIVRASHHPVLVMKHTASK
ncbi:MAG: universal stress protein [Chloroflexi bacterium]|nr:universal stress protein [Chloroflexota bacterium]